MRRSRRWVAWTLVVAAACGGERPAAELPNEDAYRANNRGVALLEQFDYEAAAATFGEALALDATLSIARLNLAVALFHAQDLEGARREATAAASLLPSAPQPSYLLGLVARAENRTDDAVRAFDAVLEVDPGDVGANVNLGQIHLEARDYPAAIARLRIAHDTEPYNVTAAYNLGLALTRSGEADEGRRLLTEAQALRSNVAAVTYGTGYLDVGRYAEAIASTGAEAELVDPAVPPAVFTPTAVPGVPPPAPGVVSPFGRPVAADARALAVSLGGGVTPLDHDADGDLDLFLAVPGGERLLRNDGPDGWADITAAAGLGAAPADSVPIGAVVADYDNDQAPDLFVLRYGASSLYRNDGDGRFTDRTAEAAIPAYPHLPGAAAFVDVDHDGDVDLLVAGLADVTTGALVGARFPDELPPAPLRLLRNNQDGTFTDITAAAGLDATGHAVAIVPTDVDNRRDIDLLVVDYDGPPRLLMNARDGTFRLATVETGLGEIAPGVVGAATADLNKDDFPDIVFAGAAGAVVALSDARGRFTLAPLPEAGAGASAVRLLDYDNDGLTDLLGWHADGPRLLRNLGATWSDVTDGAVGALAGTGLTTPHALAVADVDGDGDHDLVTAGPEQLVVATNSGDPRHGSLRVGLRGLVSNRLGIGAKVQLRAGSLSSRQETSSATPAVAPADVVFGLGPRPGADVARVLWPSGILQAELPEAAPGDAGAGPPVLASPLAVVELDRAPSSCPLLFTWNGERFVFVTDFLGGGEMGYWHGPGRYNTPDPVEYVRITGDQLRPRDGALELRVTNELEEAVFFDRLDLVVLDHPSAVELHPNEGMTDPPKPEQIHAVSDTRVPRRAVGHDGTDVTDRIARFDRRYADRFALAPFRGHARPHTLTLDLGPVDGPSVLLLTGWTDYAFSSDNVAASHAGLAPILPALDVKAVDGRWRAANVDVGIPVGRPQTIAVDLSAVLAPGEHEVRLVTSLRIYWDQIRVGRRVSTDGVRTRRLAPLRAELRERGFSAELHPNGTEPTVYDYSRVSRVSSWKTLSGHYTRVGDVGDLLGAADDMFVITRDGDEVALRFDATSLAPLPDGWTRTYLLRADGYSKEMDINSASPDTVEPLPFHAMRGYPYDETVERYPDTPAHRRYRATRNTRRVIDPVPRIETALARD